MQSAYRLGNISCCKMKQHVGGQVFLTFSIVHSPVRMGGNSRRRTQEMVTLTICNAMFLPEIPVFYETGVHNEQ